MAAGTTSADMIAPGNTVTLRGTRFGAPSGTVSLLGEFPQSGGKVALAAKSWSDEEIVAIVPKIESAPEQNGTTWPRARLRIDRADGIVGETYEVTFTPTYVELLLYARPGDGFSSVSCSPNTNDDACALEGGRLVARHRSITHITPRGTDVVRANLKNGWRISRVGVSKNTTPNVSLNYLVVGSEVQFTWSMPTMARLEYSASIFVRGPAGTSYR